MRQQDGARIDARVAIAVGNGVGATNAKLDSFARSTAVRPRFRGALNCIKENLGSLPDDARKKIASEFALCFACHRNAAVGCFAVRPLNETEFNLLENGNREAISRCIDAITGALGVKSVSEAANINDNVIDVTEPEVIVEREKAEAS